MIQRRRPIESAIAERKMFNMGGMAVPMPQPTYMDLMQQGIMGMPQQPQGIMASSQPLVDAIAADANNPYGGDTLSMAQGGVAKFQRGGLSRTQSSSMALPYATDQQMAAAQASADKQAPFAPVKGARPTIGIGESPEDMLRRRGMRPSELVNEMFPYSASTGRDFMGPLMMRPGFVGTDPRGESSPIERGGEFVANFIDQAARGLSQVSNSFGRTIKDIGEGLVTRAPQDVGSATIISQVSAVNDALRRMPKVLGVSDEELGATIKDIAEAATTAQPGISGDELSARIAEGVLSKYEGPLSEGYAMARDDANRRIVDAAPQEGFPTPQLGYEMAAEDADRTLVDGVAEAEYQNELNSKIEGYRIAMAESARPGGNPDAQMKFTQELLANPNYDREFKDAVFEAGDVGFSEEPAEAPATGDESTRDAPRPTEKPPAPENAFEGLVPRGEEEEDATTGAAPSASTAAATPDTSAAAQVAKAFDKPMTKPEAKKTIEDYKKQFMEAMPEYEGVSEEEKGYRFIEAGLRVMAGQSPNAIENIANGLKGLGTEFAKDEKEKRDWDRTVNLSAAKYALSNVKADRTAAAALAKERRARVEYVANKAGVDPRNGRKFKKGDVLPFTAGDVHDGVLGKFAPGTVVLPKTFGAIQDGLAAADKFLREGRIKYSDYQKDRKTYAGATKNLLSGLQMKLLIGDAAEIIKNNPKAITGATSFLKRATDDVLNAVGIQEKERSGYLSRLKASESAKYQAIMKRIGTKMITQILNEGNRTVSDADRKRVDELVGAYGDYFSGFAASEGALRIKLEGLATDIDSGIQEAQASMDMIEGSYNNRLNAENYQLLQQFKQSRFGRFQSQDYNLFRIGEDGVYRRQRGRQ